MQLPWHAMLVAFYAEACLGSGLVIWVTLMQRVVDRLPRRSVAEQGDSHSAILLDALRPAH